MSKPGSPKSPKSPKDGAPAGEKKALDLGELMQRLDDAVAKAMEDYSELFVTKYVRMHAFLGTLILKTRMNVNHNPGVAKGILNIANG